MRLRPCRPLVVSYVALTLSPVYLRSTVVLSGLQGFELTILEVHVGTPIETCRDNNRKLLADTASGGGYADAIFENLVYRYEEPNGMTRWDSPLFTVPWDDETPPFAAIWEAMIGSDGKGKVVKPNQATVLVCTRAGPVILAA